VAAIAREIPKTLRHAAKPPNPAGPARKPAYVQAAMLRFLSRLLGYVVLAAGFVGLVYDGARSVANNGLRVTSLSDLLMTLFKERGSALQSSVESVAPWLWQALVLPLTLAPACLLGLGLGAFLLWLGQPPREPIGFLSRP
jgi:hypothetical protein